jgi:hypothetical protein
MSPRMPDDLDPNYDLKESAEGRTSLENPFRRTKLAENGLKMAVRRPSREGDDMISMIEGTLHSFANSDDAFEESSTHSSFLRWQMEVGKDLISPQASLRKQAESGQTNTFLQLNPDDKRVLQSCAKVSAVLDFTSPILEIKARIDENRSTELDLAMTSEQSEALARFAMETIPGLTDWKDGALGSPEAPSPSDLYSRHKPRKSRLGLFRRVQSLTGVVALSDDED